MNASKQVTVIKRDGTTEDFDEEKLIRVAVATGLSHEQANEIIKEIKSWAEAEGKVKSTEIRKRFSDKLEEIRPNSAKLYNWYQSVKQRNLETNYELKTA